MKLFAAAQLLNPDTRWFIENVTINHWNIRSETQRDCNKMTGTDGLILCFYLDTYSSLAALFDRLDLHDCGANILMPYLYTVPLSTVANSKHID